MSVALESSPAPVPHTPVRDHPLLLLAIGLLTGIAGGLLGIGGGVVLIPILVWVVRVNQRDAQGTSLALSVVLVIGNLINYFSKGLVFWNAPAIGASAIMAIGGIVGVAVASRYALKLPLAILTKVFSSILAGAAIWLVIAGWQQSVAGQHAAVRPEIILHPLEFLEYLGTGLAAGVASGFAGIGGNVVMTPLLTEAMGIDQKYAQGLAVGAMLPIVLTGAVQYAKKGAGKIAMAAWLAPGSLVGIVIGGELLRRISSPHLKLVFGLFLLVIAIWQFATGGPKGKAPTAVEA